MPLKSATELKLGNLIMIENSPCAVKSIDISKTGKHGSSKVRIEAVGVLDDKKRIVTVPGSERFEIPIIEKRRAQLLSINAQDKKASIMDLESFETFDAVIDPEVIDKVKEGCQVEYWIITEQKVIKRLV